jgi:hypothetical protein
MLRYWPAFFAVLLIVLVLWSVGGSQEFQACIGGGQHQATDQSSLQGIAILSGELFLFRDCLGAFVIENNAAITALATLLIAIFTIVLAGVSDRQAKLTKEAFIDDKRAFIFAIELAAFHEPDAASGSYVWRFRPQWRNSGDTPTRRMSLYVECELRNTPLPPGFRFEDRRPSGVGMIAPKANAFGGIAPVPPQAAITPQDIVDSQAARKFIYLWGWAKYFDVFPSTNQHITRFCWLITPVGDPRAFVPNTPGFPPAPGTMAFGFVHHDEGNCADNECAY